MCCIVWHHHIGALISASTNQGGPHTFCSQKGYTLHWTFGFWLFFSHNEKILNFTTNLARNFTACWKMLLLLLTYLSAFLQRAWNGKTSQKPPLHKLSILYKLLLKRHGIVLFCCVIVTWHKLPNLYGRSRRHSFRPRLRHSLTMVGKSHGNGLGLQLKKLSKMCTIWIWKPRVDYRYSTKQNFENS